MKAVFADTSYFIALVNSRDAWHDLALTVGDNIRGAVITTDYVLVELGNAMCASRDRPLFVELFEFVSGSPRFDVMPASSDLLVRGFSLYAARPDKNWSLTDCISMTVMRERGLTEVLTADRHFEQAGFRILLGR